MIGNSQKMQHVFSLAQKVARSQAPVLITGETGTGKELIARLIHHLGSDATGPFVPVNCGAIPEELAESELFGHVRGAFTGASETRKGRFQRAHNGTLFFDEIGEMSQKLQVKLLRVLQDREVYPVGSDTPVLVRVRVIAATNRNLWSAVKKHRFREDLFYRLNVLPLHLPPLRERYGDVELLVTSFLAEQSNKMHLPLVHIDPDALAQCIHYPWPGNVREVENVIERLVVMDTTGSIGLNDLPEEIRVANRRVDPDHVDLHDLRLPPGGVDLQDLIRTIRDQLIFQALAYTGGNQTLAANLLRIERTTLLSYMKRRKLASQLRRDAALAEEVVH